MRELIKIKKHNNQNLVDARELHVFLEVQTRFNDWIINRIEKYEFIENQDYVSFTEKLVNGGRKIEYGLTLDMAKELSMVENNDRGREARRYFIQKEKEAVTPKISTPTRKELANWVIQQEEEIERLRLVGHNQEKTINTLAPKAELMQRVLETGSMIDIGQAAKILGLPFGRNTLFSKLRKAGIFFKNRNEPKQEYIDRGYFKLKEAFIERTDHPGFAVIKVLVSQKGLEFIASTFKAIPVVKTLALIE